MKIRRENLAHGLVILIVSTQQTLALTVKMVIEKSGAPLSLLQLALLTHPPARCGGCLAPALLLSHGPGRCLVRTGDQIESEVFVDLTHQVLKPEDHPVVLLTFLEKKRSEYYGAEFIEHSALPFVCRAF